LPKRDYGAAASNHIFAALDSNESGEGLVLTDGELMQAVAAADARAFRILMERHVPKMTALARRITLNFHDADEVVQESFLRVWTNAPRWKADGPAQFHTWLARIVTNLSIDRYRKPKPLPLEAAGDPPDPDRNAEDGMQMHDEARLTRQAMAQLSERQRAAIVLYYFEDMTAAQAAEVLGQSLGATEVMLTRARRALRGKLADMGIIGKESGS
jgi:RNA polymerase sigma-70 factor (ECF subfamily)